MDVSGHNLTLPDLKEGRADSLQRLSLDKFFIEIRFENEILANQTSIKNTEWHNKIRDLAQK